MVCTLSQRAVRIQRQLGSCTAAICRTVPGATALLSVNGQSAATECMLVVGCASQHLLMSTHQANADVSSTLITVQCCPVPTLIHQCMVTAMQPTSTCRLLQDMLGLPRGTIRATVLIETILAAFEMDEIIYELREHSAGLNCGRWDYVFSFIKKFRNHPAMVLPNRYCTAACYVMWLMLVMLAACWCHGAYGDAC